MRIISGTRRGHKLFEFEGGDIRPTTDRVKESIFNLIDGFISGGAVLDLFAGSGALGFEALSRGAMEAVMVDISKEALSVVKRNADKLGFLDKIVTVNTSYQTYLKTAGRKFDIIFLDPPYNKGFIQPVLAEVVQLLSADGIIVLESDETDLHGDASGLKILKQKRYGRSYVTIYQRGDVG